MEFEPKQDREGRWYTYDEETELYWAYFAEENVYKSLVEYNQPDEKPELYYDNNDGYYYWRELILNYDEENVLYYIQHADGTTENLPAEEAENLENDLVPTWYGDVEDSTTAYTPDRDDEKEGVDDSAAIEGEGEGVGEDDGDVEGDETDAEGEDEGHGEEVKEIPDTPKKVDKGLPPIPMPGLGGLYQTKAVEHELIFEGCKSLLGRLEESAFLDYFKVNKWGSLAVGRCSRSFSQLITGAENIVSLEHRVSELLPLIKHLNFMQLMAIRVNNNEQWSSSSQNSLRVFSETTDVQLPLMIAQQFVLRGMNKEEASSPENYYVARYGPRDEKKEFILDAQQLLKGVTEQILVNMGRSVIFIEALMIQHPIADSQWNLSHNFYYDSETKIITNVKPNGKLYKVVAQRYGAGSSLFNWAIQQC